jgi:hypothetical protein
VAWLVRSLKHLGVDQRTLAPAVPLPVVLVSVTAKSGTGAQQRKDTHVILDSPMREPKTIANVADSLNAPAPSRML